MAAKNVQVIIMYLKRYEEGNCHNAEISHNEGY